MPCIRLPSPTQGWRHRQYPRLEMDSLDWPNVVPLARPCVQGSSFCLSLPAPGRSAQRCHEVPWTSESQPHETSDAQRLRFRPSSPWLLLATGLGISNNVIMVIESHPKGSQCCPFRHTEAVEDALKTIFKMAGQGEAATTSALAQRLSVTAPTVSAMLKRLAEHGLVRRGEGHTAILTAHGTSHAADVTRRHRLLETFLARVLDVPWDEVHAEAEVLEHAVSDRLLARIDEHLGHPVVDPHGDPIPQLGGAHSEKWGPSLDRADAGSVFDVERVDDRDSAALRYLAGLGIRPGVQLEVVERGPFGGPLWLRINGKDEALSEQLSASIYGRPAHAPNVTAAEGQA